MQETQNVVAARALSGKQFIQNFMTIGLLVQNLKDASTVSKN
jgi:hypothetical protein